MNSYSERAQRNLNMNLEEDLALYLEELSFGSTATLAILYVFSYRPKIMRESQSAVAMRNFFELTSQFFDPDSFGELCKIKLVSGLVQPELAHDCSWSPGQVISWPCNVVSLRYLVSFV